MAAKAEFPLIHPSLRRSVFGSRSSSFSKAKLCNAHILELSWAVFSASCPPEIFNQGAPYVKVMEAGKSEEAKGKTGEGTETQGLG